MKNIKIIEAIEAYEIYAKFFSTFLKSILINIQGAVQ